MVKLPADYYCGTLSLRQPFFAKGHRYFTKLLPFCTKMPDIVHPTGQLFMAVHLIGYGSVPILHSVFYPSQNSWEAPGWQVIAVDADVKQVITSWLQTLNNSVFTLEYKPWYNCGANAKMVVRKLRYDVYHLLYMCIVLIIQNNNDMRVFITLFFESSLYIHCILSRWVHKYWVFWMVGFLCHLLIIFTMNYLFSSDFHLAMPTQFCNLPYIRIIYWKLHVSCLKIFP